MFGKARLPAIPEDENEGANHGLSDEEEDSDSMQRKYDASDERGTPTGIATRLSNPPDKSSDRTSMRSATNGGVSSGVGFPDRPPSATHGMKPPSMVFKLPQPTPVTNPMLHSAESAELRAKFLAGLANNSMAPPVGGAASGGDISRAEPLEGSPGDHLLHMNHGFGDYDYSPLPWTECFQQRFELDINGDRFVTYTSGNRDAELIMLLLHGGGHSALSWGPVAKVISDSGINALVVSYDSRAHGESKCTDEDDLSAERQVSDTSNVLKALCAYLGRSEQYKVCVCGHSMGGAIAIKFASAPPEISHGVLGVCVIDVVEGTALSSLPYMLSFLQNRPSRFKSVEECIKYTIQSGQVKRVDSARVAIPPQLVIKDVSNSSEYSWRTNLEASEKFWKGWFTGLSKEFLGARAAKMLILAGTDRFDRELTIAQMQGKFQTVMFHGAGHAVHQDKPEETADALINFVKRNHFVTVHHP
mmetsp:Transcript_10959/g.18748  ORF Transcript_10959/g.18748 Transcript_10959/m.18748 type:complete len:474 (+) Transcript_10959:91-1512(+)